MTGQSAAIGASLVLLAWGHPAAPVGARQQAAPGPVMRVARTADFVVTGAGDHAAWDQAPWVGLEPRQAAGDAPPATRVKALYSPTALYVLMDGADRRVTATFTRDFENLWTEDVFEVFLWTDERDPLYFEYEISPLGYELPILIPNLDGQFLGWRPWHYEGERLVRKATTTTGGPKTSGAEIAGWRAEIAIPYVLLNPLRNVPPAPGTRWRANFYRVDHDGPGGSQTWAWAPVPNTFHDFRKFGTVVFD